MWQAAKFLLLLLSVVGLFVMENTPTGLRENICSWELLSPCPEWFGAAHVDGALQMIVWLLFVGLSLSLIAPVVLADYRRTMAFIAMPPASVSPCSAGDRQQDSELISRDIQSDGTTAIERDVWLHDAICRAALGRWERIEIDPFATGMGQENLDRLSDVVMEEIPQLAFDGKLPIWGKEGGRGIWKPIPREFWEFNGIDWFSLIRGDPEKLKTEPKQSTRSRPFWAGLMTSRTITEELWPTDQPIGAENQMVRLEDVLLWIIDNSEWGAGAHPAPPYNLAALEVRQAAQNGEVAVLGRPELNRDMPGPKFDRIWTKIDSQFWLTHDIDVTAVIEAGVAREETRAIDLSNTIALAMPNYTMLRLYQHEMERRWPAVNTSA